MKKIKMLFVTLIALAFFAPMIAKADTITYTNLNDTLTAEGITTNGSYKESDNQATIYLFRGHGCSHCAEFLNFLADLSKTEYGTQFKLRAYEVWYNQANSSLMGNVASYLKTTASGVPFIVIGTKYFSGYSNQMDDQIKAAITDEYNATSKTDIVELSNNGSTGTASTTTSVVTTTKTNGKVEAGAMVAIAVIAAFVIYLVDARKKSVKANKTNSTKETVVTKKKTTKSKTNKKAKKETLK